MKRWSKVFLFLGCYHLLAWVIYQTIGSNVPSNPEKEAFPWIFIFAHPVYMVFASGVISILSIFAAILLAIFNRPAVKTEILAAILNAVYIILYVKWMTIQ